MSENPIGSYAKIFNVGHKAIRDLFHERVLVEEKVDGSQFSFGLVDGELHCRSKRVPIHPDDPGMFRQAYECAAARADRLQEGWTYRGEFLAKPKHNALAYNRVPHEHVVLWDIETGPGSFLPPADKYAEAERLGLEVVPVMYSGRVDSMAEMERLLEATSFLGGQKVEGLVFKNYSRFGQDGHPLMGKFVSESFREVHRKSWREANPTQGDIRGRVVETFRTEPRWNKAVQHLRDSGELTETPRDIGKLMKAVQIDVEVECQDEIKDMLWAFFRKDVLRGVSAGLPEWYKKRLASEAFAPANDNGTVPETGS